jgi:peptidoglycan/xylan/chitin deacetylase (PgdA/CDA1 family)
MEWALDSGAVPLRLAEGVERLREPVIGRHFCVTFDDGYRDNVEAGEAILSELGIPATIYLVTAVIDRRRPYPWSPAARALTWDEVEAAQRRGVLDFQAHTRTHPWVTSLDDDAAWDEIEGSKRDLEERLGTGVTSFAYPAGMYGPRDVRLVERAGYAAAVTTDPGVNPGGDARLHRLRRTLIFGEDDDRSFAAKLGGLLDRESVLWKPRRRLAAARARRRALSPSSDGRGFA